MSRCLWTINFIVYLCFSPNLGGTGWLECAGIAIHQLLYSFYYFNTGSLIGFCSCVSSLESSDSLYSLDCFFNLGGSSLSCVLPSLLDLIRVVHFSVCSMFHLLVWSVNFQVPYMQDQRLEVSRSFFKIHSNCFIFKYLHM